MEGDWALDDEEPKDEVRDKSEDVQQTCFHPAKSKTCLMNLQHVTSFITAGGGHVTDLIPGSEASLTVSHLPPLFASNFAGWTLIFAGVDISISVQVVEYLHGVNIFQICNQAKVVQLAWQPFTDPIQSLLPV